MSKILELFFNKNRSNEQHFEKQVLLPLKCRPATMQIKPFKAFYPKVSLIGSANDFCANAKNSFRQNLDDGLFKHSAEDSFYIYQIEHGERKHIGLVGLNNVDDFLNGHVKKHEDTLHERELQQKELFLLWKGILKPILVTHTPVPELASWLSAYAQTHAPKMTVPFHKEGSTHRFWAVPKAEDISFLQSLFARHVTETYIADGHHRASTTAMLYQDPESAELGLDFSHLYCAWFAADQLDILDYNRVIGGVKAIGSAKLMAHLSKVFDIDILDEPRKPLKKHELIMFLGKQCYALRWRNFVLELAPKGVDTLDTALLNDLVFKEIFNIPDVRTDTRITYVDGSKGLEGLQKAVKKSSDRVGFAFYPVTFEDLARIADAGENLPPKSTYFEPRLKSGLLVQMF
jgi:uncharacterized protein (DUF1015 family)